MCQNEAQTTKAIKEAQVQCAAAIRETDTHYEVTVKEVEAPCATQAQALEKSHKERMLKLEHEALAEEGHDCQTFMEACSTALQVCPFEAHGVLMYPLQLLTSNMQLAAMLATTPQLAPMGRELPSTACPPTVSRMPAPPSRAKWQHCSSNQEAMMPRPEEEEVASLDITLEEHPHQRGGRGETLARLLKESHQEAKLLGECISRCTTPT